MDSFLLEECFEQVAISSPLITSEIHNFATDLTLIAILPSQLDITSNFLV